jgi:hypothetical protein
MATFSGSFTWVVSILSYLLIVIMLLVVFRRKLYRRLLFFTVYLVLLLCFTASWAWISRTPRLYVPFWGYLYWIVEFSLSFLRLLTIAEISRRFLGGYPAIRALASWLLIGIAGTLLLWTTFSAVVNFHHLRSFILLTDLRFECTQAVLLLTLLMIGVYYRIRLPALYQLILIGIGVYSSIQVANNLLGMRELILPNSIFDYIRRSSMTITLGIWTYAIWSASAVPDPQPTLIPQATYDRLSPDVHERLKNLNDKLAELVDKSRR